jgi:dynactin 1
MSIMLKSSSRMVNQFEHLSDLYLPGSDLDLGERELDLALSLDHDVDFFASAMAWTKTSLLEIFKDDGGLLVLDETMIDNLS